MKNKRVFGALSSKTVVSEPQEAGCGMESKQKKSLPFSGRDRVFRHSGYLSPEKHLLRCSLSGDFVKMLTSMVTTIDTGSAITIGSTN